MTIAVATPLVSTATKSFEIVRDLSAQEINLRAKQFTVRIDGASIGTGVIVDESDTTYTVLTNWHVVENKGEYFVQTIDGRKYPVDYSTVKQLPNLDLAILQFERQQNYQLAQIGDSNSLIEGQNIYFAGYPGELRQEDNRYYRFFPASLVGILPESTANGYALVYNGEAFPGMSGSPVLDNRGFLVGIHGETNIHALTGGTSNYAIPINSYQVALSQIDAPSAESSEEATATTPSENQANPAENNEETATTPSENQANPTESNEETATTPSENEANPSVTVDTITEDNSTAANPQNNDVNTEVSANNEPDEDRDTDSPENTTTPLNSSASPASEDGALFKDVPSSNSTNSATDSSQPSELEQTPQLLSRTTGIDYTSLKELLASQQWEQANRKTRHSIARIIDTAKRKNQRSFITLNAIADFACQDIRTIDRLWQQYSDNQFGFAPQQAIWQKNRRNSDFSLNAWRRFATEIGWKQGEINDGSGYLLYEQLSFDPQTAPEGHLPWWFAASDEQQDIIKTVFNRCSLQETEEENEATTDNSEETEQNTEEEKTSALPM